MVFFRIKKIKGKEYAYLVSNKWKKKTSRQKVKGYLGRVYRFDVEDDVDFLEFLKIKDLDSYFFKKKFADVIKDLILWEVFKFKISQKGFVVDLDKKKVTLNKRDVVLLINEGYLCNLTLKNLIDFKSRDDEELDGYYLARGFVEAGIKIDREIFVRVFEKLGKEKSAG